MKIKDLIIDPSNARKHSAKNLDAIKGSLAKFGQQKPIVVSADNIVIAGNGTLEAARALGWKEISVIRSTLKGTEAIAYAIADNRTGELAEWDNSILNKTLKGLVTENFDVASIGFDIAEAINNEEWGEEEGEDQDDEKAPSEESPFVEGESHRIVLLYAAEKYEEVINQCKMIMSSKKDIEDMSSLFLYLLEKET